jgi:hypothetical protein
LSSEGGLVKQYDTRLKIFDAFREANKNIYGEILAFSRS